MAGEAARGELNWLLEHLINTVDRVRQAVILSPDGLTMGNSPGLSQPNTATPCRTQSLSVTTANRSHEERCFRPTDPAALRSSQSAPASSPSNSSGSSTRSRSFSPRSRAA